MSKAEERVALVCGASSGIGEAIATRLAADGYRVMAMARRREKVESLAEALGANAAAFTGDVTVWPDTQRAVASTVETFGRLDVLVANAGMNAGPGSFLGGGDPQDWAAMVQTNLVGTGYCVRAALPALLRTRGQILIVGSVLGRYTLPGSMYSASKAGVAGLAEAVRAELVGHDVCVTHLAPGPVATAFGDGRGSERNASLTAGDIADAAAFALSRPAGVDINEILLRPHGARP